MKCKECILLKRHKRLCRDVSVLFERVKKHNYSERQVVDNSNEIQELRHNLMVLADRIERLEDEMRRL